MSEALGFAVVIIFLIVCIAVISFVLYEFYHELHQKRSLGEIWVTKSEDGNYIWDFKFYDKVTYEAIENMKQVTFKVKKGAKDGANTEKDTSNRCWSDIPW